MVKEDMCGVSAVSEASREAALLEGAHKLVSFQKMVYQVSCYKLALLAGWLVLTEDRPVLW